jgi:hypothetical protein
MHKKTSNGRRSLMLSAVLAVLMALGGSPGFAQNANVNGDWQSNIGLVYRIVQTGDTFRWTVVAGSSQQTATGKINGNQVEASWSDPDSGSATGMVSVAAGQQRINWDNSVTFFRPSAGGN